MKDALCTIVLAAIILGPGLAVIFAFFYALYA